MSNEAENMQEPSNETDTPENDAPETLELSIEDAAARIAELEAQNAEMKDKMMRALAEAENTRRRGDKARQDMSKFAVSGFAKEMLNVADNLRRALDAVTEEQLAASEELKTICDGVAGTERELLRIFTNQGITKLEPMDEIFDPNFHEVMFEAPVPGKPAGTIIQLVEPGYMIHDRLLRPARVGVAKGEEGSATPEEGSILDEEV